MHGLSPIKGLRMVALLLAAAAASCLQEPEPPENVAQEPVTNRPAVVQPSPALDRAALLASVAQASSAAASGAELPGELRALDGRQFEVRIRFGCRGGSLQLRQDWLGWSHDPQSRTIRVRARPTITAEEPLVERLGGEFEAVEGFWIPRPWLLQPACPAGAAIGAPQTVQAPVGEDSRAAGPSEPVPSSPRIGIAQFFTANDPRTGRRDDRAYEAVHTLLEGEAIGSQGFDLVLAGRLRSLAGRGPIACVSAGADRPPECIVSADFQRVWIEQPGTGEVIADWGGG